MADYDAETQMVVVSAVPGRWGAHEYNDDHPGGEAKVLDAPVIVAKTPLMLQALQRGQIREVSGQNVFQTAMEDAERQRAALAFHETQAQARERAVELRRDAAILEFAAGMSNQWASNLMDTPERHQELAAQAADQAQRHRQFAAEWDKFGRGLTDEPPDPYKDDELVKAARGAPQSRSTPSGDGQPTPPPPPPRSGQGHARNG
jgi:hypothetical protein